MTTIGGYVRHRDRMVQESVFQDIADTLIACRWMAGTTSHPLYDPYEPGTDRQIITTAPDQVLKLLQGNPVTLIDYFPETTGDETVVGDPTTGKTAINTFAVDNARAGEGETLELGSNLVEQPYQINMAFYAASDAVAQALFNDLRDRYSGRIVADDSIALYNFNADATVPVVRMEVESFRYARDEDQVSSNEVHMFFGELNISDYVDAG